MTDCFTPEFRSEIMSRIRSSGTRPEARLESLVRQALGYRWRIDRQRNDLSGKPDIVVPALKVCIFADGCFFHACPAHWREPRSNRSYWVPKIEKNRRRDRRVARTLRSEGWAVWRIWEHDLKPAALASTAQRLQRRFEHRRGTHHVSQITRSRRHTLPKSLAP